MCLKRGHRVPGHHKSTSSQKDLQISLLLGLHPPCLLHPPPLPPSSRRHDHPAGKTDTWLLQTAPEASGRRGPDQASRPGREPDCHDAGHHGPGPVLLQCQADDREGPGPAAALIRARRQPETL